MIDATNQNFTIALQLASDGFCVFPCHSGGGKAKQPMPFIKWRDASTCDEKQIRAWWRKWPDAAVGLDLAKSNLVVIDCDRHDIAADGVQAYGDLVAEHGADPDAAPIVATPSYGNHIYFRQPEGKRLGNGRGSLPAGIDVRGAGGYVIAPGTVMQDGRFYELFGNIAESPELPEWLCTIIEARNTPQGNQPAIVAARSSGDTEIEDLLSYIPADCGYDEWVSVLMAIHALTNGAGFDIADRWSSSGGQKYCGAAALAKKWNSFRRSGISGATLAEIARRYGADLSEIAIRHMVPEHDLVEAASAARRIIENYDGSHADAATGEIIATEAKFSGSHETIDYPAGLVGDIARWITDTARRPQPELSIGAALSIVGTVAGRQFSGPTKSGTHLYVLGLAPTGKGKDHPLQQISRIMAAAGFSQHVGPSEFISMPAVVNFLTRKPLSVCPMDEFGGFMKRINSKRASGFESSISKVLRTMWSSSFAPYLTPEWASKPSETIHCPSMSIFGASTPEQFYSAMEGAHLEDGTLNRFLLVTGRSNVRERDPLADAGEVPSDIVDRLRRIYFRSGEMAAAIRNDPGVDLSAQGYIKVVPWCADGSQKIYSEFGNEVEKIMDREKEAGAFYARTVEMSLRIATIVAIGRMEDDQIRKEDIGFGVSVSRHSANIMATGAADYMSDNENQANAQKIIRAIKARGGRCSYREIAQSMKNSVRSRDMRDLLAAMCDAGQLEKQEVKPPSGPPSLWYQVQN